MALGEHDQASEHLMPDGFHMTNLVRFRPFILGYTLLKVVLTSLNVLKTYLKRTFDLILALF